MQPIPVLLLLGSLTIGLEAQASAINGTWLVAPPIVGGAFMLCPNTDRITIVVAAPTVTCILEPGFLLTGTFTTGSQVFAALNMPGQCGYYINLTLTFSGPLQGQGSLQFVNQWGCSLLCSTYSTTLTLQRASIAAYQAFGYGCPNFAGPVLDATVLPSLTSGLTMRVTGLPTNVALVCTGFDNRPLRGLSPIHLAGWGMPGCELWLDPIGSQLITGSGGSASGSLVLPANPALVGVQFYQQAFVPAPGMNAGGAVLSNGVVATVGW